MRRVTIYTQVISIRGSKYCLNDKWAWVQKQTCKLYLPQLYTTVLIFSTDLKLQARHDCGEAFYVAAPG